MFWAQEIYCENCQDKLDDLYQCSNCKSYFCETCILQQQVILKSCLICESFDSQYIKSYQLQDLDQNKIIPCIYKDEGCQEQIKLKDIDQHIKNCKFTLILCKYCGQEFIKKTILQHKLECCRICSKCEMQIKKIKHHNCSQSLQMTFQMLEFNYKTKVNQLKKLRDANKEKLAIYEKKYKKISDSKNSGITDVLICQNGHHLNWEKKSIGKHCCEICKSLQLPIRFTCSICLFYYCQKCKFQAFTGMICPRKHTMKLLKNFQQGKQCDVCDEKIHQKKENYIDDVCDYVICNKCFKEVNYFESTRF